MVAKNLAKVTFYRCGSCGESSKNPADLYDEFEGYECPFCCELYEDEHDALACCDEDYDDDAVIKRDV